MSKTIFVVDTLMDGLIGFERKLDAEYFKKMLPPHQQAITELLEVPMFDGPHAAHESLKYKQKQEEPEPVPA